MRNALAALVTGLVATPIALAADALVVVLPQPYAKVADSALFGVMSLDDQFYCETFEDGLVNTPALSLAGGTVRAPASDTDSVDGDDGAIDGLGSAGHSYRCESGGTVSIAIAAAAFGGTYPERLAFAWTDGPAGSTLTLTITTGANQAFVRTVGPLGDSSQAGTTAEDRLVAITASDGVKSVQIASSGNGPFEIDHVQYEDPVVAASEHWNQHEFSDDGKDDILWFNPATGTAATWLMNGLVREDGGPITLPVPATWQYIGIGATDQTGKAFIFWRDSASGFLFVWKLSGHEVEPEGVIENTGAVPPEWQVIAVADVDGDIDADLVFRHSVTGQVNVWILDNHSRVGGGFMGAAGSMQFLGCADLNGDRRDDLLWRDDSGYVKGWLLNGQTVWSSGTIAGAGAVPSDWSVDAIGDLDGDGCDDLVWRSHSSGTVAAWRMAGLSRAASGTIATNVPLGWQLAGVADLDGDRKEDLLWKHSGTDDVNGWLMDGLSKSSGGFIKKSGPGWTVCNR